MQRSWEQVEEGADGNIANAVEELVEADKRRRLVNLCSTLSRLPALRCFLQASNSLDYQPRTVMTFPCQCRRRKSVVSESSSQVDSTTAVRNNALTKDTSLEVVVVSLVSHDPWIPHYIKGPPQCQSQTKRKKPSFRPHGELYRQNGSCKAQRYGRRRQVQRSKAFDKRSGEVRVGVSEDPL